MTIFGISSASGAPRRSGRLLSALAVLFLAGEGAGLFAQFAADRRLFVVIALAQGAVYALAAIVILKGGGRGALYPILLMAALFRIVALFAPVYLSTDINRYVWDGRVQGAGVNPYRYIPTDPHLKALRDPVIFPHINRSDYAPTIYPPAAEMLFFLATRFGGGILAMKLAMVLLEAIGIAALLSVLRRVGRPPETILLYAWHPLPIWQIAGSGHVDAAIVGFVALALAAALSGRRGASGVALAAATLVKFFPAVLAPALWRPPDWRLPVAYIATIVALYLPYLGVGSRVLGFLPGYLHEERLESGGGIWLLALLRRWIPAPIAAYLGVALLVMAGLAWAALRRPPDEQAGLAWAAILAGATLLIVSPHYPWYFVWLAALLAVAPVGVGWWPAMWLTLSAPLLDWHPVTGFVPHWVGDSIYGGFIILCLGSLACFARSGGRHVGDRSA